MNHPLKGPLKGNDELRDASRGERLQRVMADAGVASRRACEELIKEGHVKVNGRTVTDLPIWVDPAQDRIVVKGRPLHPAAELVYVMLNKPTRTLCAASDEPGADRRTVVDLVKHHSKARLFPVGRLDYDTTGLLILTNDGDLTNKLTHPRYGGVRVYEAVVAGVVPPRTMEELNRRLGGRKRGPGDPPPLEIVGFDDGRTKLRVSLVESKGRTVLDLLGRVGHHVKHLDRIGFGPLKMSGVARGQWRDLERWEVVALKKGGAPAPAAPRKTKGRPGRPPGDPAAKRGPRRASPADRVYGSKAAPSKDLRGRPTRAGSAKKKVSPSGPRERTATHRPNRKSSGPNRTGRRAE